MTSALAPIIDLAELRSLLEGSGPEVRLLDVRWALDGSKDKDTYLSGHIPGAVYVDLGSELAGPASADRGRHPLPDPEDFAATLRRVGVGPDTVVIGYDDSDGSQAGRLVWMLRALGQEAALLDGGLRAWDGELETDDVVPAVGDVAARGWDPAAVATIDEVAAASQVVDARAGERYRGEVEPIDPRAGHVPGAVSVPFSGNVDAGGRFLPADALRERFLEAGLDPQDEVIVYCGSGVTATHDLLALERAGFSRARLFPGSWSQWSADSSRPIATGADPGGSAGQG